MAMKLKLLAARDLTYIFPRRFHVQNDIGRIIIAILN